MKSENCNIMPATTPALNSNWLSADKVDDHPLIVDSMSLNAELMIRLVDYFTTYFVQKIDSTNTRSSNGQEEKVKLYEGSIIAW